MKSGRRRWHTRDEVDAVDQPIGHLAEVAVIYPKQRPSDPRHAERIDRFGWRSRPCSLQRRERGKRTAEAVTCNEEWFVRLLAQCNGLVDLGLGGRRGEPKTFVGIGAGRWQRREIRREVLPDAWIGAGKRHDHRIVALADKPASLETAHQAGILQDKGRDGPKAP